MRQQSAMEYLMTYGWAILIIAIVLGVLYYLGVFGGVATAPRAQPGSCQVFRPNGPGASYDAALSGTCNNELPEYVAEFGSSSSKIIVANTPMLNPTQAVTVSFWLYLTAPTASGQYPVLVGKALNNQYFAYINPSGTYVAWSIVASGGQTWPPFTVAAPLNQWQYYAATYNSTSGIAITYANGVKAYTGGTSGVILGPTGAGNLYISAGTGGSSYAIADVQIYNTSLSANEIQALYYEGIGGAPVRLQNLIGWWPLNGNPNDYSGNMNNGVPTSVAYTSSWTSGYTAP